MRAVLRHAGRVSAGLLCLGSIAGCVTIGVATPYTTTTSTTVETVDPDWPESSVGYAALRALRDAEKPSPAPLAVPRLRGLDTERLTPLALDDPAAARAHLSLADALADAREHDPNPAANQTVEPPSEGALVRAQRFYASGLAKLLAGDNPAAARDLAAAAQLDPTAPSPWLRLAEAQAQMNQGPASLLSRKKAVDLGSNDAISLAILGMQATRTGQHELAAHYLARCLAATPERVDPLLRQVALVRIAYPLLQLGALRASIDALQEGLVLSRQLHTPTRFGKEASDIARRAPDLWLQIGDTACRLGDDDLAARAYATAAGAPSVDPGAILIRQAYVLLRSGRRASVGLLVLDNIAKHEGRADARDIRLLSLLNVDEEIGPLVAVALGDLAASLPKPRTNTAETALVLARAAVSTHQEAESLLRAHALTAPGNQRIIDALFALPGDDTTREMLALHLVQGSPTAAESITKSLVAWHSHPVTLLESLPETSTGRLMRLFVLRSFGRNIDAADTSLLPESPVHDPIALAYAESIGLAAAASGQWDVVDRAFDLLTDHPVAAARLCQGAQRYTQGFALLGPVLEGEPTLPILLLASELAMAVGEMEQAGQLLDRAVALDPFDERPYEGLVNVSQALGDQQRTAETIRELRSRVPSSHLLRWVNAQEEARRGLLDRAERSLRELAEDAPGNGNVLGLLLNIWAQRSNADDTKSLKNAEYFLASLTDMLPHSPELIAAHSRLLRLMGQQEEAEGMLRAGIEVRPSPILTRVLELHLRQANRIEEADALAASRFIALGLGIDMCLEQAEFHAHADRWNQVTPFLRRSLPAGAQLNPPQRERLLRLVTTLASRPEHPDSPTARADAAELFSLVHAHGIELPWPARYSLWALVISAPDATDADILDATDSLLAAIDSMLLARSIIGDNASRLLVPIETLAQARGQVAYQLAGSLQAAGKEDAAIAFYRRAIVYYPDHAWIANDLGYFLLERHESLDEAERLLELAYRLRPDHPSIADSLGWLRYKLGQIANETRPDGTLREGAVSMLIAASGLPGGRENPTIHDHLGDALWRSGEPDRARAVWIRAQQLLIDQLVRLRDSGRSPRRTHLTEIQTRVGAKLDAIRAGEDPAIAPLIAP